MKEGRGEYLFNDKSKYEGDFRADEISGKGHCSFANGSYEG